MRVLLIRFVISIVFAFAVILRGYGQDMQQIHRQDEETWAARTGLPKSVVHDLWRLASHFAVEDNDDSRIENLDVRGLASRNQILIVTSAADNNYVALTVFLGTKPFTKLWSEEQTPDGSGLCGSAAKTPQVHASNEEIAIELPTEREERDSSSSTSVIYTWDLSDFRTQFDWIIANETGLEARHDVGVLATNTIGKMKARLSQPEWEKVAEGVAAEKQQIAFHDESNSGSARLKQPHFQEAQFIFNQEYDSLGYSQYVSLDGAPNSSVVYVTVYVYGNTNQTYMQTIGATHTVYITNEWDGNGIFEGGYGAYSPSQYINLSNTVTGTWDRLQHTLKVGPKIVCTYAGPFFFVCVFVPYDSRSVVLSI